MNSNDIIISLSIPSIAIRRQLEQGESNLSENVKVEMLTNSLSELGKSIKIPIKTGQVKVTYQEGYIMIELDNLMELLSELEVKKYGY